MSLSPSSISIILLSLAAFILLFVTQCQRTELKDMSAQIDAAQARERSLQEQVDMTQATLDAERQRIMEIVRRLDQAITDFTNGATKAHEDHETRMETISHVQSQDAVDWMCEPVPDDIKRLFCGSEASGGGSCPAD